MKKYETPEISIVEIDTKDVVATDGNTRFEVNSGAGNITQTESNWLSNIITNG